MAMPVELIFQPNARMVYEEQSEFVVGSLSLDEVLLAGAGIICLSEASARSSTLTIGLYQAK